MSFSSIVLSRTSHLAPRTGPNLLTLLLVLFVISLACAAKGALAVGSNGTAYNGAVPGAFSVSPTGAATYSIPIEAAPGIGGMAPQLSLNYSSQSGNGQLGLGWSLGGMSAITRCPQTYSSNGKNDDVSLAYNDRFCLDGQRLVLVQGEYGYSDSVYHTERDTQTKVVAYGIAGNGPQYFIAQTKSGLTIQYGYAGNARIIAPGTSTAMVWNADKITDTVGNYQALTYTKNTSTGEYYPQRIDYTGNTAQGLATSRSVQFTYATRTDKFAGYIANSKIENTVRMTNAKVYQGSSLIRDYQLTYSYASVDGASRLDSLKECDGANNCLPSITLTWTSAVSTFTNKGAWATGAYSGWSSYADYIRVAELNGDGFSDLVIGPDSTGKWSVMLGSSTGFINKGAWITGTHSELAFSDCSSGSVFEQAICQLGNVNKPERIRIFDVNGDGLSDVAMGPDADGKWYVMQSDGTKFVNKGTWATGAYGEWTMFAHHIRVMDADGDGLSDFVLGPDSEGKIYVMQNTGSSFVSVKPTTPYPAVS